MQKLTINQARDIIITARDQVRQFANYRFGQALYNLLPKDLEIVAMDAEDHYKWYNTLDENFALSYFYDHFVELN